MQLYRGLCITTCMHACMVTLLCMIDRSRVHDRWMLMCVRGEACVGSQYYAAINSIDKLRNMFFNCDKLHACMHAWCYFILLYLKIYIYINELIYNTYALYQLYSSIMHACMQLNHSIGAWLI